MPRRQSQADRQPPRSPEKPEPNKAYYSPFAVMPAIASSNRGQFIGTNEMAECAVPNAERLRRNRSETGAEADADVVDALVLLGETAVRDVVDKGRDLPDRVDQVAELERFAEQNVRAEALAVGRLGDDVAVVE